MVYLMNQQMSTYTDVSVDRRTDCKHCIAERKACGRAHYEHLSYEWLVEQGREVVQEKMASEKQVAFARKLLAEKELTDRKRSNRVAKLDAGELTAKEAKDMIDELIVLPQRKVAGPRPTEKQMSFLRKLLDEKELLGTAFGNWTEDTLNQLDKGEVSAAIDALLTLPRSTSPAPSDEVTEDGMYLLAGRVFKVQVAKRGSGRLYAKELDKETGSFEYSPGSVRLLAPDNKMTLDDAKRFGQMYGICCRCGADLTDEGSIADGIGPVCASKFE